MESSEDKVLSVVAILAVVFLSYSLLAHVRGRAPRTGTGNDVEANVSAIAQSIAIAEGYYAPGGYDGHALPYKIHNPGSLKKPALGAEELPTWKDTGLVVFPTEELGWAALRHQINLMLSGESDIYSPSDTLMAVAVKYADGDLNWAQQVANNLGVSPQTKLSEVSARSGLTSLSPLAAGVQPVAMANPAGKR